jgi:hypothetical protein
MASAALLHKAADVCSRCVSGCIVLGAFAVTALDAAGWLH